MRFYKDGACVLNSFAEEGFLFVIDQILLLTDGPLKPESNGRKCFNVFLYICCYLRAAFLLPVNLHVKKKPHTSATIATPPQCRQWSNQMLLPCGALLAVRDGLKTAVRASGRFLRSVVFLCKGNSFSHDCTAILRLVHDADSGSAQSVQTLDFLSALVASHLSLKKALRALTTAC